MAISTNDSMLGDAGRQQISSSGDSGLARLQVVVVCVCVCGGGGVTGQDRVIVANSASI